MKRENISKPYFTQEQIDAAIAVAPAHVDDPDSPYDPDDEAEVENYWTNATRTTPGEHPHQKPFRQAKE